LSKCNPFTIFFCAFRSDFGGLMKNVVDKTVKYSLGENGEFVIENYNSSKPFASFFPGIAGPHGVPMWVFYVNRGQCICSIGTEDKEHPIMEFLSANRAYQLTSTQGFRTFLKLNKGKKQVFYEPFQEHLSDSTMRRTQRMIIQPAQLTLEEVNHTLGIKFTVDYFNVPEDTYAGLVRTVTLENIGREKIRFEMLDGLPLIIPFGVDNVNLKHMRRLVESFVEVVNYERGVPYFKGKVKQEDRPEVVRIKEGNFYVGFTSNGSRTQRVKTIVDPEHIFGSLTDYSYPQVFLKKKKFTVSPDQILENRLPCAMGLVSATINPGKSYTYNSITGTAPDLASLNAFIPRISRASYVKAKARENRELIDQITQNNFVKSASPAFDLYSRQNFLDNTLRGGLPISLPDHNKVTTIHLYSRKHGDLERDYNDYHLSATNYSQGNGNYRDINQNRRSDLLINPDIGEGNVEHFYNLIQLDGFNPLVVKVTSFSIKNRKAIERILKKALPAKEVKAVIEKMMPRFTPGQLMSHLSECCINLKMDTDVFMGQILACCEKHQETDPGHGYWSDHWTYNIDLLENYLAVYPENLGHILTKRKTFTFFDNPHRVLPREEKYVLWDGLPMQLGAVVSDAKKEKMISERAREPQTVRTKHGKGEVYRTTLINKLLSLVANKLASLDPSGVGIEMESDKPNWYDALNGLPGQLGSSLSETLELKRHMLFLLDAMDQLKITDRDSWKIYEECGYLITQLDKLLKQYFKSKGAARDVIFWDAASSAKEAYREWTVFGISGKESTINAGFVRQFLKQALRKVELGIKKAWDRKQGVLSTYFMHNVTDYELIKSGPKGKKTVKTNAKGQSCYRPKRFKFVRLPLFLEGPVHYLRIEKDSAKAAELAQRVRESGLFDKKLKMYKVNECLDSQPPEIGRCRIFSRGWLENESIWLHMEYKYLLELLRSGLYKEFYRDIKTMLVPNLDPTIYGRSILENSSFIASSANPDKAVHGNGFVARLSGSTAEFVQILLLMTAGEKPFRINASNRLELVFEPKLAVELFNRKVTHAPLWIKGRKQNTRFDADTFGFSFLGSIIVTYHNPKRKNTFGRNAVHPTNWKITDLEGRVTTVNGPKISGKLAHQIRDRKVSKIDIELG